MTYSMQDEPYLCYVDMQLCDIYVNMLVFYSYMQLIYVNVHFFMLTCDIYFDLQHIDEHM